MQYIFDVDEAQKYGLEEAIFIYNLRFWVEKNRANKINFYDGHTWTYNTVEAYSKLFPFWSPRQMRRIIQSLLDQGIIIKGNYNKSPYDRTLWYAFAEESILLDSQFDLPEPSNETDRNVEPIPDVNTDSKPDINTDINTEKPHLTERDFNFNVFWDIYDKKVGFKKCKQLWNNIKPDAYSVIFAHAGEYVAATPDKKFRKNPETYLRNQCWTDEIIKFQRGQPDKPTLEENLKANEELFDELSGIHDNR